MAHKDDEGQKNTLFVRNLPFDATAAQLEEVFSDIGPVRKCYIVTDAGKKTSRGFGYVHVRLFFFAFLKCFEVWRDAYRCV